MGGGGLRLHLCYFGITCVLANSAFKNKTKKLDRGRFLVLVLLLSL
jgi:hypothetical protein